MTNHVLNENGAAIVPPPTAMPDELGAASDERVAGGTPLVQVPPATLRRHDVLEMLRTEPEPIEWVAHGIAARGTLALLAGREKEGKSLLAMGIAARAAAGGGQLAGINVRHASVLVIDAENGGAELHRRVRALGLRPEHAPNVEVYEARAHDMRHHLDEIEAIVERHRPELMVLDSWRSLWGGDENDAGEVARVLDPLRNLVREHHVAAVLIHHMRKNGGYRGSSAIGASVENVLELGRHDDDPDRRRRYLRNPSCRFEQEAEDRWLRIEADRERGLLLIDAADRYQPAAAEGPKSAAGAALLAAANGQAAWADLARDAGLDPKGRTARRARDELVAAGALVDHNGWTTNGDDGAANGVGAASVETGAAGGDDFDDELARIVSRFGNGDDR